MTHGHLRRFNVDIDVKRLDHVPEDMRDHFVPILHGEAELKKLVNYKEPDDAYLVVLNRSGRIVGQTHGSLSDAAYTQLRARLESLLNGPK